MKDTNSTKQDGCKPHGCNGLSAENRLGLRSEYAFSRQGPRRGKTLLILAFVAGCLLHALICASLTYMVSYDHLEADGGIFDLGFGFGPAAENLVTGSMYGNYIEPVAPGVFFSAGRMPAIPFFLAAVAMINNSLLVALVIKTIVVCGLMYVALYQLWIGLHNVPRAVLLGATFFALTFPAIVQSQFSLYPEEPYLIGPVFFLFVNLIFLSPGNEAVARGRGALYIRLVLVSIVNAALYLTKSSMLPLAVVSCILIAALTRKLKCLAVFTIPLVVSLCLWGGHNWDQSGVFSVSSSIDGYNLRKGNSQHTGSFYPQYDLYTMIKKEMFERAPRLDNEWAVNEYYKREAIAFIKANPAEAAKLLLCKAHVFFVEIREVPLSLKKVGIRSKLEPMNRVYMVAFRILMAMSLVWALATIFLRVDDTSSERAVSRDAAITYLAVFMAYAGPFLAGFAYQRHVLPMILPTIALALWILDHRISSNRHQCGVPDHIRSNSGE